MRRPVPCLRNNAAEHFRRAAQPEQFSFRKAPGAGPVSGHTNFWIAFSTFCAIWAFNRVALLSDVAGGLAVGETVYEGRVGENRAIRAYATPGGAKFCTAGESPPSQSGCFAVLSKCEVVLNSSYCPLRATSAVFDRSWESCSRLSC